MNKTLLMLASMIVIGGVRTAAAQNFDGPSGHAAAVVLPGRPVSARGWGDDALLPHIKLDIHAKGVFGNRLEECHLTGEIAEWTSRPSEIRAVRIRNGENVLGESAGTIEAGVAHFVDGSKLEGCSPAPLYGSAGSIPVDVSGDATFLIVDSGRQVDEMPFDRQAAGQTADRLIQGEYRLTDAPGMELPLFLAKVGTEGKNAAGWDNYRFRIVLVKNSGGFDAVITRETLGGKFHSKFSPDESAATRVTWRSMP